MASYSAARRQREGVVARPRDVDGVALLDEPAPKQARHLQLVLDDEHAHAPHCRARG